MICEQCALREDCLERERIGRHAASCEGFYPDLSADRSPLVPLTPEARRRPMHLRSVRFYQTDDGRTEAVEE